MEQSQTIPLANNIFTDVFIFKFGVFVFPLKQFQHITFMIKKKKNTGTGYLPHFTVFSYSWVSNF
jgi:hypothetical protein